MMLMMMMMMMMGTRSKDVIIKLKHLYEGAVEQELRVSNCLCSVLPHPEHIRYQLNFHLHHWNKKRNLMIVLGSR